MKSSKGSAFEREICKELSLWWTNGKSDDVFWRTAGSGARATTRRKSGKKTFGQAGDIQATDPIGQPLIDLCNIELKRGYSKSNLFELVDAPKGRKPCMYEQFIMQAMEDAEKAGVPYWILIVKRDRRVPIIIMPYRLLRDLRISSAVINSIIPFFRIKYRGKSNTSHKLVGMQLSSFLEKVHSSNIKNV